jgi:RNA polymerase sigma factor (sigma-70 family)
MIVSDAAGPDEAGQHQAGPDGPDEAEQSAEPDDLGQLEAPSGLGDPQRPDLVVLLAAASRGDEAAWDELVHRLSGLVWSICRSYRLNDADAGDAFQFTWLRLLDKLNTIQDPRKLPGWLATTCRRECMAIARRRSRSVSVGEDAILDALSTPVPGADGPTLLNQRNVSVWQAFFRLGTACQRLLWHLVIDPPKTAIYSNAAHQLDVPIGTLGPTRGRCLQQLRTHLVAVGITDAGDFS